MTVFLANEQSEAPVDEDNLVGLAQLALDGEGVAESELSILIVDTEFMRDLNARAMGERRPTDVLAFPIDGPAPASGPPPGPAGPRSYAGGRVGGGPDDLDDDEDDDELDDDEPWLLGDVVLCPAYAADQAKGAGQSLDAELELLLVHGILHLCGLDHAEPEEERAMKARTEELLAKWRSGQDREVGGPAGGGRHD
jgi:probable rRNA maturation factor